MLHGEGPDLQLDTPLVGYGKGLPALRPDTSYLFLKGAMTDQVLQELLGETFQQFDACS